VLDLLFSAYIVVTVHIDRLDSLKRLDRERSESRVAGLVGLLSLKSSVLDDREDSFPNGRSHLGLRVERELVVLDLKRALSGGLEDQSMSKVMTGVRHLTPFVSLLSPPLHLPSSSDSIFR